MSLKYTNGMTEQHGNLTTNKNLSTFVTGDCLNASQQIMQADVVGKRENDLFFYYRNHDSPVWRSTPEKHIMPKMPTNTPDPLLDRTFGALVQGDGDGNRTALLHFPGSRTLRTSASVRR